MAYPKAIERLRTLEGKFPITAADLDTGVAGSISGAMPKTWTLTPSAPLTGGGTGAANRTLAISAATAATASANGAAGSAIYAADGNKTARNMAATPAGVAAQIAAAMADAGGAPKPQIAEGVGQWLVLPLVVTRISGAPYAGYKLPSGGTWVWITFDAAPISGISSGGTTLLESSPTNSISQSGVTVGMEVPNTWVVTRAGYIAWRIA